MSSCSAAMAALHITTNTPTSLLPSPRPRRSLSPFSLASPHAPLFLSFSTRAHNNLHNNRLTEQEPPSRPPPPDAGERQVPCEVEVVSWRERRICACVSVYADVEDLWRVLTDYERLADFIPNLIHSGKVECPHEGRVWLEQIGVQRALYWHIEARVVLEIQETRISDNERELHFSMVDGDFKKFEGKWSIKAVPRSSTTILSYEVTVIPRFSFPAIFVERIIKSDLPVNLRALACRAEGSAAGVQYEPASVNGSYVSSRALLMDVALSLSQKNKFPLENFKGERIASNLGELPTPSSEPGSNWGVYGKFCSLDRPCMVDEVHLRRLDGLLENGGVHRCVHSSITIKASASEIWDVLTSYEKLPEIVPNLAISKVLLRENNKVRILQEGCKGLLYMVLHARVILDLHEKHEQEISFEQVEGDFESFHGKWVLEPLGDHHTLLKYTIESKLHKDTFLYEAIVEEVIYEDLPSNLCAIRDYVERRRPVDMKNQVTDQNFDAQSVHVDRALPSWATWHPIINPYSSPSKRRPKVPGLQRDINVLKTELLTFISNYGQEGFMPMRKQLRMHGRVDVEKAITRMGGFRKVANLMNLSLAYKDRKPKGYWDNLDNLQAEISRFQRNWGMDPAYMPSRRSFERAGRYDIARAFEKWGGLQEVSRLLSLQLRYRPKFSVSSNETGDDSKDEDVHDAHDAKSGNSPFISQEMEKWFRNLQDFNWL